MSEWIFLGDQTEAGMVFQLGMDRSTGQYFRFEPLATRLRGNEVSALRQEIEGRSLVCEDHTQAITPVVGPIFNQERYWVGWKDRNGQHLFASESKIKKPLREELVDLYPLIYSYSLWHQAGLIVGQPEWRRLSKDGKGVFMPDPKPLFYLAKPIYYLPIALERCRPSEEYLNQPLGFSGDVFYLGLIIYYYITGEVPFPLHKGWPTQAILNGEIINLQLYRPDLLAGLERLILSMLAPDPLKRPTIEIVKEFWYKYLKKDPIIAESDSKYSPKRQARLKMNHDLTKTVFQWAVPISILVLLIIGVGIFYPVFFNHTDIHPLKAAANFYQEMERVDFHSKEAVSAQSVSGDFMLAAKSRLEMVAALLSKPLFKVDRMRLVVETPESAIVEANLIWWEWSGDGWAQRVVREKLVFQKKGKKLELKSRNRLQE